MQRGGDSSGWSLWVNYRQSCNNICPRHLLWLSKEKEFRFLSWTCPGYRNCCPVWMSSSLLNQQEQSVTKWVREEQGSAPTSSCVDEFYSTQGQGHTARYSSIPERLCITSGPSQHDWAWYNHQWNLCRQCRICTNMYHDYEKKKKKYRIRQEEMSWNAETRVHP